MSGYYQMQRGWMNHPIFKKEPLTEREAWQWLIEEAAWKETKINLDGKIVTLKRGQLSHSIRFLADKWSWNRRKAEMFINRLKSVTMIETANGTKQQVITICNYDKYQADKEKNGTVFGTVNGTILGQSWDKEEEGKERKKKISDDECARDSNLETFKSEENSPQKIFESLEKFFNCPTPYIMAPIIAWLEWGADFQLDILPTAKRYMARKPDNPPRSLTWLNEDIARSIEQRKQPMPDIRSTSPPNGFGQAPAESDDEWFERKKKQYGMREEQA